MNNLPAKAQNQIYMHKRFLVMAQILLLIYLDDPGHMP